MLTPRHPASPHPLTVTPLMSSPSLLQLSQGDEDGDDSEEMAAENSAEAGPVLPIRDRTLASPTNALTHPDR